MYVATNRQRLQSTYVATNKCEQTNVTMSMSLVHSRHLVSHVLSSFANSALALPLLFQPACRRPQTNRRDVDAMRNNPGQSVADIKHVKALFLGLFQEHLGRGRRSRRRSSASPWRWWRCATSAACRRSPCRDAACASRAAQLVSSRTLAGVPGRTFNSSATNHSKVNRFLGTF